MQLKRFESFDPQTELTDYASGKVNYEPLLNIFMGPDRAEDYYVKLGKYVMQVLKDDMPSRLEYYSKPSHNVLLKEHDHRMIAIIFLTGVLDEDVLKKIFYEPIFHAEFGEGFEDEPDKEGTFASYFVKLRDIKFHIGYDHRGTTIEVEEKTDIDVILSALKSLVDLYKEKV